MLAGMPVAPPGKGAVPPPEPPPHPRKAAVTSMAAADPNLRKAEACLDGFIGNSFSKVT
jgi:hypothetical protein